jgi:hypothetical protein
MGQMKCDSYTLFGCAPNRCAQPGVLLINQRIIMRMIEIIRIIIDINGTYNTTTLSFNTEQRVLPHKTMRPRQYKMAMHEYRPYNWEVRSGVNMDLPCKAFLGSPCPLTLRPAGSQPPTGLTVDGGWPSTG